MDKPYKNYLFQKLWSWCIFVLNWQINLSTGMYTVWVKKKFTPRTLLIVLKIIYEQYIIIYRMKECFIPNRLVSFLCGMCSCMNEQEALFARVQKSTCAKVMPTVCIMWGLAEWENELNVSNEMHCICFLQIEAKSHTRGHKCSLIFHIRFDLICVAWLILLGMFLDLQRPN